MQALEWSQYKTAEKCKAKGESIRKLYDFFAGESGLNSHSLGVLLDVLGLDIKPTRTPDD